MIMRKLIIRFSLFLFFLIGVLSSYSQHTITTPIDYRTTHQDMWDEGPGFNFNFNFDIFHIEESGHNQMGSITNILGGQFGAVVTIDWWLLFGSYIRYNGFNGGEVDVRYPVEVVLTLPDDQTFNQGDNVTIESSYTVMPGWDLTSRFPVEGIFEFGIDFGFGVEANAELCFIGCTTINILDQEVPADSFNIIDINTNTGIAHYPCMVNNQIQICESQVLPIVFNDLGGLGLSGSISIPYVETTDYLDLPSKTLYAHGASPYMTLELDIIRFIMALSGPNSSVYQVLSMLQDTVDLGSGFSLEYDLLDVFLRVHNFMVQDLRFDPTIWTKIDFPTAVAYSEVDPGSGAVVNTGIASSILFEVDHNLVFKYPCNGWSDMLLNLSHTMTNDFNNHTWDSITFNLIIQAFTFTLNLPSFPFMSNTVIPELCIPIVNDTNSTAIIANQACMPSLTMPQIDVPDLDLSYTIGPLVDLNIPLGHIPLTWYNHSWQLAGFSPNIPGDIIPQLPGNFDTLIAPTTIVPRSPMSAEMSGTTVFCFGDSTGKLIITVLNGASPYTYTWTTGDIHQSTLNTDTLFLASAGVYGVTIVDGNGCTIYKEISIPQNTEITISLSKTDVWCAGDSTGQIIAIVNGGTPGYDYHWTPYGINAPVVPNLYAGNYTLLLTDFLGCTKQDSITLVEINPKAPVDIVFNPTEGCQPLTVNFSELNPPSDNTYLWSFGDGGISDLQNPQYTYLNSGSQTVSIRVRTAQGCDSLRIFIDAITVFPLPVAEFSTNPTVVRKSDDPTWTILFTDESTGTFSLQWDFDDPLSGTANYSTLNSVYHSFIVENTYTVMLITTTSHGCVDTVWHNVQVIDDILSFSNVFTPNNDGFNDFFEIKNVEKYPDSDLKIFNRWGNLVYQYVGYRNDWDGRDAPDGTYYYLLTYVFKGETKVYKGSLSIVR
jgi:gliding motility-associated-like protein